uniref:Uncharacterized protein n=1 Tax=Romanomermis culicivorax TaxID=13658 RepID=A0A915L3U8_ROMCU
MIISSYSKLIVRFPASILICGIVTSFAITILTVAFVEWPDLSDPTAGFNTSGTEISDKLATFRYLQANIGPGKYFHQFPNESLVEKISGADE